jgi:taurine dioxygenase
LAPYRTIKVTQLTTHIGALVEGVDLTRELAEEQAEEIRAALHDHLVIFLRDQEISDEQHLRFARHFGAPNVFPATRARGLDQPLEWIEDTPESPPKADLWHTDVAFLAKPPDVAVLSMQDTPPVGGDTLWLSLYALYDALSPALQGFIDGLEQDLHPGPAMKESLELQFGSGVYEKVAEEFSGARHPLVRRHPVTGRPALFLCGRYVKNLVGLSQLESDTILDLLREGLHEPGIQVRWQWRQNDVAVWDERCTNHRALGDHWPAHRKVRRCTVGEGVPLPV